MAILTPYYLVLYAFFINGACSKAVKIETRFYNNLHDLRPFTVIIEAVLLKTHYAFLPSGQILPPMEPPPNRFYR